MKKVFALALSLIMLLGTLSTLPVMATEATEQSYTDVVSMTTLYNGNKTVVAGTVYSISSVDELFYFAELCNEANGYFAGVTVILDPEGDTDEIIMNEGWTASATAPTGENAKIWTPIKIFKGVLDGQNNTISGFYVADSLDYKEILGTGNEQAGGIFCILSVKTCEVKNLNIENSYIYSQKFAGTIAGVTDPTVDCNGLTISNVSSSAIIDSAGNGVGGILGNVFNGNTASTVYIKDSEFSGEVRANNQIGGFVGTGWRNINITNCVNSGKMTSNLNSNIGGIYGVPQGGAVTITGCVNEGEFVLSNKNETNVGGIVGYFNGATALTVDSCVNNSVISCNAVGSQPNLGGIVGKSKSNNATIKNCVNLGDIVLTLNGTLQNHEVGGIIGHSTGNALTVNNCANFGDIKSEDQMGCTAGGIVGSIGCATTNTNAQRITDCLSAGDISVELCTPGGIIGVFQRQNLTITRCAFTGTVTKLASGTNGAYGGTMMGNLNNSTNITFEDCYFNNAYKPLPTWTGIRAEYGSQVITVKATGKDTLTQTYTAGANPTAVSNALKAAGALSQNSITDLNAIQNLKAFDWANTTGNGWKIQKYEGKYLPMPISCANLIAEKQTLQDPAVNYDGVQLATDGTAVRFIATVDMDIECDAVGFDVLVIKGGTHLLRDDLSTNTVYESLTYTKDDISITPEEGNSTGVYAVDGKYLCAMVVEGIDTAETVTFAVKAYSMYEGVKTYDDTCIVSVHNGKVFSYYK